VEHQLMNPILRLFEAISDNPKSLLTGDFFFVVVAVYCSVAIGFLVFDLF